MPKIFSLDEPADKLAFMEACLIQDLLYGNTYIRRDGRDIIVYEDADEVSAS